MIRLECLIMLLWCGIARCQLPDTYPANEYEHSLRRDYLKQKEEELQGNTITLTADEQIVDRYLQYHKDLEFKATENSGFRPARPIDEVMGLIESSQVFRLLKKFPKGGNMHSHENHQLNKGTLLDIVWTSPQFDNLYILPEGNPATFTPPWTLDLFVNPPPGYIQVKGNGNYTKEQILEKQHLLGILSDYAKEYPNDSGQRWLEMNTLWDRGSAQLINHVNIKRQYIIALLDEALNEGVQYLETRKNFAHQNEMIYELSPDPEYGDTNGKKYLDTTGEYDINMTKAIVEEYIQNHTEFIGLRRITYSTRFQNSTQVQSDMENALALHQKFPDHLVGFDLVAEEDAGKSHLYFLSNLLALYDGASQQSKMAIFLHTAETSWPRDLISSNFEDDQTATAENTYEALILGAKRVGHGLAYIKFPYLLQEIKSRDVAIEVCPVSNQLLALRSDLRNHPAEHYMRLGIPVILGADDPGSFGYNHFTIDWYEAFMSWGLTLRDLKQLSMNAILYSAMSESDKQSALTNKWAPYWDSYINDVRREACNATLPTNTTVFYRIFPREGAKTGSTKVHIFGRFFEKAICETVICRFGQEDSATSHYVSNSHIICMTPEGNGVERTVSVMISLDSGVSFMQTGYNYTYKYDPPTDPPTQGPEIDGAASLYHSACMLSIIMSILCIIV